MSSMLHNQLLTKNSIDEIFDCFAKNYDGKDPLNVFLVGGGAIMIHFDFRQSTIDLDAFFKTNNLVEIAINKVAEEKGLPKDWLNQDFINTPSYSPKINEVSKLYKAFNNVVFVYCLEPVYLIAMKLKSSRPTGGDLDDIIKMIYELRYKSISISYEEVINAYQYLYTDFSNTYDYFLEKTKEAFNTPLEEIEIILGKHKPY